MNPLLRESGQSQPDLRSFLSSMNPTQARQQVETLLSQGRITQSQLDKLIEQAKNLGGMLGLR